MSYTGYERVLCRNGHLEEAGCYEADFEMPEWRCGVCNESCAWWEQVDQTNDAGTQTHLAVYRRQQCRCSECGHQHDAGPIQYCIPAPGQIRRAGRDTTPLVPVVQCGATVLETGEHFDTVDEAGRRLNELEELRDQQRQRQLKELRVPYWSRPKAVREPG